MQPLIFAALLFSAVAMGNTQAPAAQKKQELSAQAREAAQDLDSSEYYLDHLYLKPMPKNKLQAREMKFFVVFGEGWSRNTEADFWSVGERSSLFILIGEGEHPSRLHIEGTYLSDNVITPLYVNGQLLSETALKNHTVDLPPELEYSPYMHIELRHLNPMSPSDIKPKSLKPWRPNFKLEQIRVW